MKKLIAIILLCALLFTTANAELWGRLAVVIDVDIETAEVAAVDELGNIFVFVSEDPEEWDAFDACILILDDRNTLTIRDDEVMAVTYIGQASIEQIIWICKEVL